MTSGGPDLFVVCKQCRSEVSPYITECPYCGSRLRKRAPKLDRDGRLQPPKPRRAKKTPPSLGRLRANEIPGIRPDSRPKTTLVLIAASLLMIVLWRTSLSFVAHVGIVGDPGSEWWRIFTAPFVYDNSGYAFAVLGAIALFGWLVERRHGPAAVAGLFVLGGVGGTLAAVALQSEPLSLGANGAALALLVAWAVPDVREARGGIEVDGDLLGTGVILAVLLLLPVFVYEANWIAGGTGALVGLLAGLALDRRRGGV